MIIRIISKCEDSETIWYWRLETDRGDAVCESYNPKSGFCGYTRKNTALNSAWRFIDEYMDEHIRVEIMDGFTGKSLGSRNLG